MSYAHNKGSMHEIYHKSMIYAHISLRFWWTESPLKSPHESARASRPTQQRALENKCTLLSPQKRAPIFGLAPKRAQEIAQKSKTLKKSAQKSWFLK